MLEIRFHGRGGHGAKTAAVIVAGAFLRQGMHAQAFPEFGPERRGAPVRSFVRASKEAITTHESVTNPDIAIVLDESLMELQDITEGLKSDGILLINSPKNPDFFKKHFNGKIRTIDANRIAVENIGQPMANIVILGALASLTGINLDALKETVSNYLGKKDKTIAEKNIRAMEIAFKLAK